MRALGTELSAVRLTSTGSEALAISTLGLSIV